MGPTLLIDECDWAHRRASGADQLEGPTDQRELSRPVRSEVFQRHVFDQVETLLGDLRAQACSKGVLVV